MSQVLAAIRQHHRQLISTLTEYVTALANGRLDAHPQDLAMFLKSNLWPHAVGAERSLYPALEPWLKTYGQATATMRIDHEYIAAYICQIDVLVQTLQASQEDAQAMLLELLRRQVLQLEALVRVHLDKEECVYLPLLAQYLSPEAQQRVLDGMHAAYTDPPLVETPVAVQTTLDVRGLPPVQRHAHILATFAHLRCGEAFVLINDHDPKPLYYQFVTKRQAQFTWEYVEQGPEIWRVRIGRCAPATAA